MVDQGVFLLLYNKPTQSFFIVQLASIGPSYILFRPVHKTRTIVSAQAHRWLTPPLRDMVGRTQKLKPSAQIVLECEAIEYNAWATAIGYARTS